MTKQPLRAIFEKTGRAAYISHLDLMRVLQRAMNRASLPVWYTEGFNPHIYVSLPLALPLGVESQTEIMDFAVVGDIPAEQVKERLNAALPEGIRIRRVSAPSRKAGDIAAAEYVMIFYGVDGAAALDRLNGMMSLDKIELKKKTKRKAEITVDIKPYINISDAAADGESLKINLTLPTGAFNVNTAAFNECFSQYGGLTFDKTYAIRTKLLCGDGTQFV